jgi:diguanylate cyclase (GGDEF)-like protein/PAS domain S-box-containing protein
LDINNIDDGPEEVPSPAYRRFRRRLMLGLLGIALLAVCIVAFELRAAYTGRLQAARIQTQNLARAVEAHVLYSIEFANVALVTFSNAIKVLPEEQRASRDTLQALMSAHSPAFSEEFWNTYIDANGIVVASSSTLPLEGKSYRDRDYFQYHAQGKGKGLYVGPPMFGRITDRKVFFISRRVESDGGTFLGVVVAPIDAGRFAQMFDDARFDTDVSISLIHRSGKTIARAPQFQETFGADVSAESMFEHLRSNSQGTLETVSPADGTSQLTSFRALKDLPLVVAVGISGLAEAHKVNANVLVGGTGVLLMVVIVLLSAHFALRAYRSLEERQLRYRKLYDSSRATEAKLSESERRLRLITDNLPVLIGYVDRDQRLTFANRAYESVYEVAREEIAGRTVVELLDPLAYNQSKRYIATALDGMPVHFERETMRRNQRCCEAVHYIPERVANGAVLGFVVMVENITERKRGEESRLLASLVYENTSEGMLILELDGAIVTVNPSFSHLSGLSLNDVAGKHLSDLASDRHGKAFFDQIHGSIAMTGQWQGEIWNRHKNGDDYLIAITLNTVFNQAGEPVRRVALFSDITKKKATEELVWKQANFDALTGLPNRRLFHERLRLEMKKSDRTKIPMAVVFIDLDRFKEVNDTLGHAQGDMLLKEAALRLNLSVRATDTVARLGGDEFTVILGEVADPTDVARIADEILKRLTEPFALGDDRACISASIGITLYPDDGTTVDVLLKNADQAMYSAKYQGRNRFNYFAPAMQEASKARTVLTGELHDALANDELRVVYQTIVSLETGEIQKAEALARWQHPTRGLLSAQQFMAIAEASGMIVAIGDLVFRQAARLVKRLQEVAGGEFQLCVNKSSLQFRTDGTQYQDWLNQLDELGLSGSCIIVEVTESLVQHAGNLVTDKLLAFRDAGMQVALDDFGTGYCSLSFLKRLDIDYLKINPTFVSNLTPGSDEVTLCEAVILMAHKLGMKVIAEGIETKQQLELLTHAGCDFGQGFLFSRPVSAEELEVLLQIPQTTCG